MKIKIFIYCVILFGTGIHLYAQSVDSLISEALLMNPQLKALQQKIESSRFKSESVSTLPPPTAGVEFQQVNFGSINIWDKALAQEFFISQMFPLGGKLSAMEEAEGENVNIAAKDYQIYLNRLVMEIRTNYYQLWMAEHHSGLRSEVLDYLRALLESSERSYILNKTAYSDVLLLKSEIASAETEIKVLDNEAEAYRIKLNGLIGREINDQELYVLHNWEADTAALNIEEYRESLIQNNPSLKKMDNMIRMNELEMQANSKEGIPDLMLQGSVMRMPQGMFLTTGADMSMLTGMAETDYSYSLMASITLPFMPWSSGKYNHKNEELEAGIRGIEYEKVSMYREMSAGLESAAKKLESAQDKIKLLKNEVIPLYKQALSSRISEYQNKLSGLTPVIDNIRMYLMKEEELGEAMSDYQMLLAEINEMTGVVK